MNSLGMYFGPQVISIVETKGKLPVNNIQIPWSSISKGELLEEKVPDEVKIVSVIKDELIKNKIDINEVTVSLSGKDLIIRTFEMPILPRQELDSAVNFEVKKYIPFKVEDLISDFQLKLDKPRRKNYVLFVGIKKEVLDKYLSIFNQIGLRLKSIEYSGFSTLRLLTLANVREKEAVAVVNIDLVEEDDINFLVLENGFPLFSRDITFVSESPKVSSAQAMKANTALERFKRELRISLSYYDRTFPLKNINKIMFVMDTDYRIDLENFMKEIGLNIQFININKCIGKPVSFSLPFVKGYATCISKINTVIKIDLLSAKEKSIKMISPAPTVTVSLITRFKSNLMVAAICLLVCVVIFISGIYRLLPLKKEVKSIIDMRPAVSSVSPKVSYDELALADSNYKIKTKAIDELVKEQVYLTEVLDVMPRLLPKDIRLAEFSYRKDGKKTELILRGITYLGDSNKELELVNTFHSHLKENPIFTKYFKDIVIVSIDRSQGPGATVTNFTISCLNYKEAKWK